MATTTLSTVSANEEEKCLVKSGKDITYAEIGPNSPRKILLPREETKISTDAEQFWQA